MAPAGAVLQLKCRENPRAVELTSDLAECLSSAKSHTAMLVPGYQ